MRAKAKIEVAVKPEMKEAELCVLMALNMFDAAFPNQIRVRAVSATAMEVGVPDTPENAEAYGFAYRKYQSALAECDKEAKEELTRLNDEFMRSDAYKRRVERYNRKHQMRTK